MTIDLIVISDSHGRALAEGAANLGLEVRAVTSSGTHWHRGNFNFTRNGFQLTKSKRAQSQARLLRNEILEKGLSTKTIPTLSTIGFHLGQLVPPFGWYGHRALPEQFQENVDTRFASDAFLAEYIQTFRRRHFVVARKMARSGRITVVPPPVTFRRANYAAFRSHIVRHYQDIGVPLYDPVVELTGSDDVLPDKFVAKDGVHANAKYGEQAIKQLQASGFF